MDQAHGAGGREIKDEAILKRKSPARRSEAGPIKMLAAGLGGASRLTGCELSLRAKAAREA